MYIVYSTQKYVRTYGNGDEDSYEDDYIIVDTEEKALLKYEELLIKENLFTAGYAKIIESTDYHEDR